MKKLLDFVPTHLLVFFSLGTLFQYYIGLSFSPVYLFTTIFTLLCTVKYCFRLFLLVYIAVFLLGVTAVNIRVAPNHQHNILEAKTDIAILSITEVLRSTDYQDRYYADVLQTRSLKENRKVLVLVEKVQATKVLQVGDRIGVQADFKPVKKKNPYDFNYKAYLKTKNITKQLFLKEGAWVKLSENKYAIKRIANTVRAKLLTSLGYYLKDKEALAITAAMLLGQREYISKKLRQDYANAGVAHILAVSGLHVGIVVLFLNFLLSPFVFFPQGKKWKLFFLIILLWAFAFLAGLSASVVRAVTMFSFVSIGLVLGSRTSIFYALITSALLLLLLHPFYLFDVGFQMSYLAVFFIVAVQPLLYNFWIPKNKILDYFWKLTSVSIAAQLGVMPVSLYYFHQFPGLFIFSNLVIIPCLGLILLFGAVTLLFAYFGNLPFFLLEMYTFLISTLHRFIRIVSQQEEFIYKDVSFSILKMLSLYLFIGTFVLLLRLNTGKRVCFFLIGIILVQLVFIKEKFQRSKRSEFIVFHEYNESTWLSVKAGKGYLYSSNKDCGEKRLKTYAIGTGISNITITNPLDYLYTFKGSEILVVDYLGLYQLNGFKRGIVVLRQSPKINLDRLIYLLQPRIIVADGSNNFFVKRNWAKTCAQKKVFFHDTSIKGAFVL